MLRPVSRNCGSITVTSTKMQASRNILMHTKRMHFPEYKWGYYGYVTENKHIDVCLFGTESEFRKLCFTDKPF